MEDRKTRVNLENITPFVTTLRLGDYKRQINREELSREKAIYTFLIDKRFVMLNHLDSTTLNKLLEEQTDASIIDRMSHFLHYLSTDHLKGELPKQGQFFGRLDLILSNRRYHISDRSNPLDKNKHPHALVYLQNLSGQIILPGDVYGSSNNLEIHIPSVIK